jgi:hypothetical protein
VIEGGQLIAVAGVFAILILVLLTLRSKGLATINIGSKAAHSGRRLQVLERVSLSPSHALHLVRFDENLVLLASSPAGCSVVMESGHKPNEGGR